MYVEGSVWLYWNIRRDRSSSTTRTVKRYDQKRIENSSSHSSSTSCSNVNNSIGTLLGFLLLAFFVCVVVCFLCLLVLLEICMGCIVLYGDACTTYLPFDGTRIEQSNRSAIEYEQDTKKHIEQQKRTRTALTHTPPTHIMHHSRLKEINRRWHTLLSLQTLTHTHVSMDTLYSASTIGTQQLAITAFI